MLIYNANIVNENYSYVGSVVIKNDKIVNIIIGELSEREAAKYAKKINAKGLLLFPGVIDAHVHFRDPGLTHKADIASESKAAVAGGITSYMEMPNTIPQATTIEILEEKYAMAAEKSLANYSFYMGATNDNFAELKKVNPQNVCAIKVFMGSSTGNMLVNNADTLQRIFSETGMLVMTHCEDEATIKNNIEKYNKILDGEIPIKYHPLIRTEEACYKSTAYAIDLATKFNGRLHVAHLTTKREMDLFDNTIPLSQKKITAEACVHHLWFTDSDYESNGSRIKCNPAIKTKTDRDGLRHAVNQNKIDTIATDHAPHLWSEKQGTYFSAASGLPFVEWSLPVMLEMVNEGIFTYKKVVEKMCHAPAELFHITQRGYIRTGYFADLVLIDPNKPHMVNDENTLTKCAGSPINGTTLSHQVVCTIVNGNVVFNNGDFYENRKGNRLLFNT